MAQSEIEDFLSVKWCDGLLVNCDHLLHTDKRTDILLGEICSLTFDQPGLIDVDTSSSIVSQLIEIESFRQNGDDSYELGINILRPFKFITPNGGLLVAIPNNESKLGIPNSKIKCQISPQTRSREDYLVCVRQKFSEELHIKKMYRRDAATELTYPGLQIELLTKEQYRNNIFADYIDYSPIASISIEDENAELDASFIPPLAKLRNTNLFETGLISSIGNLLEELRVSSSRYIIAGGNILSRKDVNLRTRYSHYLILNSLLLAKSGLIKDMANISPIGFYHGLLYPLVKWLDQYQNSLDKQQSALSDILASHTKVKELSWEDIFIGTGDLLRLGRNMIFQLNDYLKDIG